MDYTIACYTKEFEELCYNMIMDYLVNKMGYPGEIRSLVYDPDFSIRGLFIDTELGNILKIDAYGIINGCVHGKTIVSKEKVARTYRSKKIINEEIGRRFYLVNTLFSIPEACAFSDLVDHFERAKKQCQFSGSMSESSILLKSSIEEDTSSYPVNVSDGEYDVNIIEQNDALERRGPTSDMCLHLAHIDLYYKNLWTDVHDAMDAIHSNNSCKLETLKNLPKYVSRTAQLSLLLHQLRHANKKIFLLTNSPWDYTKQLMSYLLDGFNPQYESWQDYWDIIIVAAKKPAFFGAGSTLREVDRLTGKLSLGMIGSSFERGKIYHGGSLDIMEQMARIKNGDTVLYVGDHIFADVRVSKKKRGWRTMLIVPELEHEIKVASNQETLRILNQLHALQSAKTIIYRNYDSDKIEPPKVEYLQSSISLTVRAKDSLYNKYFGSLFSSGLKPSFFSQQVIRYACIYASHFAHMLYYPTFYSFSAESLLMPHETLCTIQREQNQDQESNLKKSQDDIALHTDPNLQPNSTNWPMTHNSP